MQVSHTKERLLGLDRGMHSLSAIIQFWCNYWCVISCIDGSPPVPNAPGAPMDIMIHDANRDYVIVSWKPPNTTIEGPILGYFVDK